MDTTYDACLQAAKTQLATARQLLSDEIANYPGPIAGCDAQFNHLLADRQKITGALAALEAEVFVPTPRSPTPHSGVESR